HEQTTLGVSSPSQQMPVSASSSSWYPSRIRCSSISLILQRARPLATLRLRACPVDAYAPACADKIAVSASPRIATATITSTRVNPERLLVHARRIVRTPSPQRDPTLRTACVGAACPPCQRGCRPCP